MIFRPGHTTPFIVNAQHPESTGDAVDGKGNATWLFHTPDFSTDCSAVSPFHLQR